jgi:hypothetical protein
MTFQIRVVAIADNGQEQVQDIMSLQRTELKMETLGLTLAEGKAILSAIQRVVVEAQAAHCVAATPAVLRLRATATQQGAPRSSPADGLRQSHGRQPAVAAL